MMHLLSSANSCHNDESLDVFVQTSAFPVVSVKLFFRITLSYNMKRKKPAEQCEIHVIHWAIDDT